MLLPRKSGGRLGLDLGSSSIKMAALERQGDGIRARRLAMCPLTPEVIVDGAIVDAGALAAAIAQLPGLDGRSARSPLARLGLGTSRRVIASVSGNAVIVRRVVMPAMNDEELEAALEAEAAQHIPFALEEVNLDHQILDFHDNGQMEVLLVAVKKDKVANLTHALSLAGLRPEIVDHDPLALQNCYEYNYQPGEHVIAALLHVGASVSHFSIVHGTSPRFMRDVGVGGNNYTDALQKEFHLGFEDAEKMKTAALFPPRADKPVLAMAQAAGADAAPEPGLAPSASAAHPETRGDVHAVLAGVTGLIRLELQKTVDFARAGGHFEPFEKLYLSGGGARIEGLRGMLEGEFNAPVEWLDPFRRVTLPADFSVSAEGEAGRWAIAVGLGLREFEEL